MKIPKVALLKAFTTIIINTLAMSLDARATSSDDWRYVSEGGATMVFSYIGSQSEDFSGMVLRLRKAHLSDLQNVGPSLSEDEEYAAELDDPTIAFQMHVTSRLLPPEHLPRLLACRVSYDLLSSLSRTSALLRPAERSLKDTIDARRRRAVLATDLVGFGKSEADSAPRSFAVEIKPKWAFLPNPTYLSPDLRDVKTKYSRFVMHSHYRSVSKTDDDSNAGLSTYDPLDLFSRKEERIKLAVESLWDSWISSGGSTNNLKVFVGGKTISPLPTLQVWGHFSVIANAYSYNRSVIEQDSTARTLSPLVNSSDSGETSSLRDLRSPFVSRVTNLLVRSPLPARIAQLQRTLDSLDIEGLYESWKRYHRSLQTSHDDASVPPLGDREPEPTLDEWETFAVTYLEKSAYSGENTGGDSSDGRTISREELRYHILAYLMSATFKDCSIILRLASASASSSSHLGSPIEESVTAIDLDPKSVHRLEKWRQLDRDIAATYSKYLATLSNTP